MIYAHHQIRRPRIHNPFPRNGAGYQGNIVDGNLDGNFRPWRRNLFGGGWNRQGSNRSGYVLDTNRNGRYDRGRDGVLAFDMNRDGRIDRKDINNTNNMMKAATGNYDLNGDGRTSWIERIQGNALRGRYSQLDRNRDGRLDTHEIARGGGQVWVDHSRGGGVSRNELYSPYSLPNSRGFGPSQRLDYVDPFSRHSHTSNNFWGGGWGGCHGGHGGYIPGRMYAGFGY